MLVLIILGFVWFWTPDKRLVPFGSPDMQNFQQLLKRGDDEETSKGSTERDKGGNDDAERGQTPSETRAENVPTQGFQVSHSITLTLQVLIKQIRLQQHCLHCP